MIIKTRIVQIGNSRGIRVPKVLLEHAQLPDDIELEALKEFRAQLKPGSLKVPYASHFLESGELVRKEVEHAVRDHDIGPTVGDGRHLLRLGHGEEELESDASYNKYGRVESFLENRQGLLGEVDRLAASISAQGAAV